MSALDTRRLTASLIALAGLGCSSERAYTPPTFDPPTELYGDPIYAGCTADERERDNGGGQNRFVWTYDDDGRKVGMDHFFPEGATEPTYRMAYTRDMARLELETTMDDGVNGTVDETGLRRWTEDHQLALERQDYMGGESVLYEVSFDDAGRRIHATQTFGGSTTSTGTWTWTYDAEGVPLTEVREGVWPEGTDTFTYDGPHLVRVVTDLPDVEGTENDTVDQVWEDGLLMERIEIIGPRLSTSGEYIPADTMHWTFTYDGEGREVRRTEAQGAFIATRYDDAGRVLAIEHGFGTEVHEAELWTHDEAGRITSHLYSIEFGTQVQGTDTTYSGCAP